MRQVRWLGLCPKIKIERAWDTTLNPQQEYALWVAARRDIGGRFGLFILSSRSRIGDQFWRWEEKHEETSFHFHARPGMLAYPFDFDFPLPGVNAAGSIPTRRNHDEWGSLCRGDQEWTVGAQRAIIRS